jgi:glycosyltransferase involved in cell wall biosynthesis
MSITADQITIAITVYNRREYLHQAIRSALNQTVPVRVMVVEDCGPDPTLQEFATKEFGSSIEYLRNPQRRGLFGNWNACIERCQTRWLSILHDDDFLDHGFVAAMIELAQQAGERGLYWGQTVVVDDRDRPKTEWMKPLWGTPWREVPFSDVLYRAPFSYPGQLFDAELARSVGKFRDTSLFCGDWELWSKLIAARGGAETAVTVATFRDHSGWDRGSNRIYRSGKTYGLMKVQLKRNLALARKLGLPNRFDRNRELARSCIPTRYLLHHACGFSRMYLGYNTRLLCRSTPPHIGYAAFQLFARCFGPGFVCLSSRVWNFCKGRSVCCKSAT